MLEALGMDHEAELVYRLLLEHPNWGVEDIARYLSWQDDNVRAALDRLADLKLVRGLVDNPKHLRPVSPQIGLAALLVRSEVELNRRQEQIEASRAAVATLAAEYGAGFDYVPEAVERYEGADAVRCRLAELMETTRYECLSFQPGRQHEVARDAARRLDQTALERGVKVRAVLQESFRNDPATLAYVRSYATLGGQARTVPALPMRLVIIDDQCALVPLDPNDSLRGALELRSPGAVAAMRALFEQFWSVATPWDEPAHRDKNGLSGREQELLRLLAAGHTDEFVSRKLGLSLRTIRRMTSKLMEQLKAQSRFQAGVNAAQRHWL